ncbi:MAG: MOSC domain-containing protein [Clostridia bacterium]
MNEKEAVILAVCVSEKKGQQKHPVEEIRLLPGHGVVGDAHAGNWHRQLSLLARESAARLEEKLGFPLAPGAFAENVLCEGLVLPALPVGTRLMVGSALCEVTQIGKECHADCAIRRQAGDCVMPREGIFAVVLEEGCARPGDRIRVLP